MIAFFLKRTLITERLGRNMLEWRHSGFSVDLSVKIAAVSSGAREALAQYMARPPVSAEEGACGGTRGEPPVPLGV